MDIASLKSLLIKNIPNNLSKGKIVLSVGESILLVLDVCKKAAVDNAILDSLNRLYLEGLKTEQDRRFIRTLKEILKGKNFWVLSDPKTTNEDPTRRYFETNLAYTILQNSAELLDHYALKEFTQNLKERLLGLIGLDRDLSLKVKKILAGEMDESIMAKDELEFSALINQCLRNDFYGLSEKACRNLAEIAYSTAIGTLNTKLDQSMSPDIYRDGIFDKAIHGRGVAMKTSNERVKTTAKGLMKSTHPLPLYHDLVNPVAEYNDKKEWTYSSFERPADQSNFMPESPWNQYLFSRQTQPYSNGISGTMLLQIRNMLLQKRLGNPYYRTTFQAYMTVFSALLIYNSGGHSFFELFEVFKLPLCRELMDSNIQEAIKNDTLLYQWLYTDQKEAFEKALQATQSYHRILLHKKMLHAELFGEDKAIDLDELFKGSRWHFVVMNPECEGLARFIRNLDKKEIDIPNAEGWTPLMLASQLGKHEYVKSFLAAGADLEREVAGFSSLVLAVKAGQWEITKCLLEAGACIKKDNNELIGGLKERSLAIYFACRQYDQRILNLLLEQEKRLTLADKKDAILTALEVENLAAIRVLFKHMTSEEKDQFSKKYKSLLLEKVASSGNLCLVDEMMSSDFGLLVNKTDRKILFFSLSEKGFLPDAEATSFRRGVAI